MVSADVLLHTWERGRHFDTAARVLYLLSVALPDHDRDTLASFDPGLCDWHLLRLRLAWFGAMLRGQAECLACGEHLEIEFDASAMSSDTLTGAPIYTACNGGRFRLACIGDLIAIGDDATPAAAAQALFERCSLDERPIGDDSSRLFDEVDAGLATLASRRALQVNVSCALCGHQSLHTLDPCEFLWTEIRAAIALLLDDVHRLARAYGWSERDILALSATRRAAYLSRVD